MKRFLLSLCLFILPLATLAAPKSDLWAYWAKYNDKSTQVIDHSTWGELLSTYVVAQGQHHLVRYEQFTTVDKQKLKRYIQQLTQTNPHKLNRNEQMAYWINLYNAATVNVILDNYPVSSITKLGGVFAFGPWNKKLVSVNGKKLTLNDIEHRILRPIWQDKRIHYAVNCASLGCPNLLSRPFQAKTLNQQLNQAARAFINSPKGITIKSNGMVILSKIYEWYAQDFGSYADLVKHLDSYHKDSIRAILLRAKPDYDYDWKLNKP